MFNDNSGQTLIEVVVVMAVSVIVIGALVFATISSLRNSQFSKNQAQATKLAQEGIERVRTARDRGEAIGGGLTINSLTINSWQDPNLWSQQISPNCTPNCYFKFNSTGFQHLTAASDIPLGSEDPLGDGKFKRVVILSDDSATYQKQKIVTVIVRWVDFSGNHDSKLTTILRNITQ